MMLRDYNERLRGFFDSLVNSRLVIILEVVFIIWIIVVNVMYYRQYVSMGQAVLKKILGF